MALGQDDSARAHLSEVDELGSQFGNNWLESSARTWLAVLARGPVGSPRPTRSSPNRCARSGRSQPITLTVTFALVAHAQLLLARGDASRAAAALGAAEGLRARAGLRVWPIARRTERDLRASVAHQLDAENTRLAFEAGAELTMRDALALIGDDVPAR